MNQTIHLYPFEYFVQFLFLGRFGGSRTHNFLVKSQALCQVELRTETRSLGHHYIDPTFLKLLSARFSRAMYCCLLLV